MLIITSVLAVIAMLIFIILAWIVLDPEREHSDFDAEKIPPSSD